MKTALGQAMSKNGQRTPHGGFTLSRIGAADGANVTRRGRPESETDTPVNIENGLYRDNGEGVAATPLPYPLQGEGRFVGKTPPVRHLFMHKPLAGTDLL